MPPFKRVSKAHFPKSRCDRIRQTSAFLRPCDGRYFLVSDSNLPRETTTKTRVLAKTTVLCGGFFVFASYSIRIAEKLFARKGIFGKPYSIAQTERPEKITFF